MPAERFRRYHSLDALRAAMMLLGLVLHSAVSYLATPLLPDEWPYSDPQRSVLLDLTVFFIHLFRMPVFFVVAGFFGALLYSRDGAIRMAANRARRVLLPLVLFWVLLYPLIAAGFTYANGRVTGHVDWTPITSGAFLRQATLVHLWFLWDLAIFYAAALAIAPLAARAPTRWRAGVDRWFGRIITSKAGILLLALVTTLTLLPMTRPAFDTSFSLLPPIRVLVAYGVFFTFGWLLYRRRDVIEPFGARWKAPLAVGAITSVAYLFLGVTRAITSPLLFHLVCSVLAGLSIWLLIFGIVGAFVSRLDQPRPAVRYLSDAAYWMYLVHLPLIVWGAGVIAPNTWPAIFKFAAVLSSTALVAVATYHLFVRSTAIGTLLNGRRHARRLSAAAPELERASM